MKEILGILSLIEEVAKLKALEDVMIKKEQEKRQGSKKDQEDAKVAEREAKIIEEREKQQRIAQELAGMIKQTFAEACTTHEDNDGDSIEKSCENCANCEELEDMKEDPEVNVFVHGFRSPFPFLMPGQVPAGVKVMGPFPENEEEAKELQRLAKKGMRQAMKEETVKDPITAIVSIFRELSSEEQRTVLNILKVLV